MGYHNLDNLDNTVRTVASAWEDLSPDDREAVRSDFGRDLYEALVTLAEQVAAKGAEPVETPREFPGYPPEARIKNLEDALEVQHRRREALYQARKAVGGATAAMSTKRRAEELLVVAHMFERFLTPDPAPVKP
jgi:hypothetical protein